MRVLFGFVLGVMVGSTGLSFSQSWGIGEDSRFARESRDWQMLWQQQQLDEQQRFQGLEVPCQR